MKQLFAQLALVWRELGINQKVSVALTALLVLGGLAALTMWANRPQMKLLYGGLDDKEAGAIISALQDAGVPYEIGPGGRSIFVPANQVYKTRMELATKGLPSGGGGVGFEIFDRSNFGISDFVQRTNYLRALQGELARTITGLQGVREARVMVVIPENRLILRGEEIRPTASVFVDTGGNRLETSQVNAIRSLVAAAVQGLQPSDVSVVDNHGNSLSDDLNTDPMLSTASSQMKFRKQIEDYLTQKVESMLAQVVGPGNAVVRVAAEIDNEMAVISEEKFDPEGQVPRTESTVEDVSSSVETQAQAQPVGVAANIPAPNPQAAGGQPSRSVNTSRSSRNINFEINRKVTNLTRSPGTISRITAAVFVSPKPPAQADAQPAPRTNEEISALRQVVANALGIRAANPAEIERLITIVETPIQPVVTAGVPQPSGLSGLSQIWPAAALAAALIIFIAFFLALRKTKPEQITFELIEDEPAPPPPPALLPNRKDHKISPELLNELIQQKPENVGVTIRQWLAQRSPQ